MHIIVKFNTIKTQNNLTENITKIYYKITQNVQKEFSAIGLLTLKYNSFMTM